ncbi:hypothetical protein FA95DRAFT_816161 [Auriscalpium vulgare]|uniref:Uncharacterized protein n=1 Tax=Auriscalpium vulgare TaxID=40419 RepID=A0ACB8S0P1_9AGAM|nr:hypothetical protein FA95DRAFT_816161 [Auriscalpium vulgare]
MPLIVIYNPASGSTSGKALTDDTLLPLLTSHHITPDKIAATERPNHSGELVLDFLSSLPAGEKSVTVILVSGDGTLHEIVNALWAKRRERQTPYPDINFVLIPGGTANALHSTLFPPPTAPDATSKSPSESDSTLLASLRVFLSSIPRIIPLTVGSTTISSDSSSPETVLTTVVASTSLHASILADSEALRASLPGIERFKVAAEANATRWYHAQATLTGPVSRYDPATSAFIPLEEQTLQLEGPFAYFLSTTNVDRLEPAFRIAPFQRPGLNSVDVLVVRPRRDVSLGGKDGEEERTAFKNRLWGILGGAYANGTHVESRYDDGEVIVEYFRAKGWEWEPDEKDEKAHLLCADGTIFTVPKGGKVVSTVLSRDAHDLSLAVYA